MKLCNRCNEKRGNIKRLAIVEENILKLLFTCPDCKLKIRDSNIPMIEVGESGINIKDVILRLNSLYKKNNS